MFEKVKSVFKILKKIKNWAKYLFRYLFPKGSGKEIHVMLRNGIKLSMPQQRNSFWVVNEVYINELYNIEDLKIPEPSIILDIGGFIGISATYFANKYKNASIHVYEPVPFNFIYIEKNVKNNNFQQEINPFNMAVHDKSGESTIILTNANENLAGSILKIDSNENRTRGEREEEIKVKTIGFEDILSTFNPSEAIFLKMDIEGAEYDVLYNCNKDNIRRLLGIILEYHKRDDEKRNGSALKDYLEQLGFDVSMVPDKMNPGLGLLRCRNKTALA
ncbi:MAG: FkbM family methyltransferase [Promethearchaeota archaeon]